MKGGCFCEGVQYELAPPLKMFSHCHCESCRRSHGAAFVSWVSVQNEQFRITQGEELVAVYESSPGIKWKFCKTCGSSIFQTTRYSPEITYIVAASLKHDIDHKCEGHVSFEERVSWLDIKDDLPKIKQKTSDLLG